MACLPWTPLICRDPVAVLAKTVLEVVTAVVYIAAVASVRTVFANTTTESVDL